MQTIEIFEIGNEVALPELYQGCFGSLCDTTRLSIFLYPDELRNRGSSDVEWALKASLILALNEESLLEHIGTAVNCFSIHTKNCDEDWRLRYIGQVEPEGARENIMQLLVPGGDGSNAVATLCKNAVRSGADIGLRLIQVKPDTLREFIQEKAVNESSTNTVLDWNRAVSN